MAVKIRLRQEGRNNRQTYRLVITDSRVRRGGAYVEMLGHVDPLQGKDKGVVDSERLLYWLNQGAVLTEKAEALVSRLAPEVVKEFKNKKREQALKKKQKTKE